MARYDLTVQQGASWARAWPITMNGEPADLTGWTVRAQFRESKNSDEVLHEWSTIAGNASVADHRVTLRLSPEDTRGWTVLNGVYDVELTDPAGTVYRISEGALVVSREVTR